MKTKSDFETADFFSKKEDVTVDDVRDNWYVERSNNILAVDYFLSYFIRVVVKKLIEIFEVFPQILQRQQLYDLLLTEFRIL